MQISENPYNKRREKKSRALTHQKGAIHFRTAYDLLMRLLACCLVSVKFTRSRWRKRLKLDRRHGEWGSRRRKIQLKIMSHYFVCSHLAIFVKINYDVCATSSSTDHAVFVYLYWVCFCLVAISFRNNFHSNHEKSVRELLYKRILMCRICEWISNVKPQCYYICKCWWIYIRAIFPACSYKIYGIFSFIYLCVVYLCFVEVDFIWFT